MTSSQTERAKGKLATLSASFDELEALVEPLFAQTLPETLVSLEPIQQAKLQTVMPYLVYDLIFIYLKSRGIDPKTHPVVAELDRVKQYFNKINNAENPPQKRAELDKEAAQRFIKHAIATLPKPSPNEHEEAPAEPSTFVQPKVTKKMLERQQYEQELKEQDAQPESEEPDLVMYGEDANDGNSAQVGGDVKGKGKAVDQGPEAEGSAPTKRRRPAIDPFAGYGDEPASSVTTRSSAKNKTKPEPKPKKRKTTEDPAIVTSSAPSPSQPTSGSSLANTPAPGVGESKSSKKGKKKKKSLS